MSSQAVSIRAVLSALLLAAVLALAALPAAAQEPPPQPGSARVQVQSLTGALGPGDELRVRVLITNESDEELDGLRVVGTLHRRTYSRFDYQQAVDEGAVGEVWSSFGDDVDRLSPGGSVTLEVTRSAADLGFGQPDGRYGVYPIRIQLLVDGTSVDELFTSVVLAPDDIEGPVHVATMWPLDAQPGLLADGSYTPGRVIDDVGPQGRLTELVDALDADPGVDVTLAPAGFALDQVADIADGFTLAGGRPFDPDTAAAGAAAAFLEQLQTVAGRPGIDQVALAYGPGDLVALVRGGLDSEAARDVGQGRAAVAARTGAEPARTALWAPDALDPATLRVVVGAGVDTVVLPEQALAFAADRDQQWSPPAVHTLRRAGGAPLTAVVGDPWLSDALARSDGAEGAAVAAQRVLAETAAVYFERPFAEDPRGLALVPPQMWEPPRGMPAALVEGLGAASWLEPVGVVELIEAVGEAPEPVDLAYPGPARAAELPSGYIGSLRDALVDFGSLATALPGDDGALERFDSQLRAAASVHYRDPALRAEGQAKIDAVTGTVAELYGAVEVIETPPVVLTSQEGPVPVTVQSSADVPLRVRVRLETNRFAFDAGDVQELVLEAGEVRTLTFTARALTVGGTQSVRVLVEDAAGGLVLSSGAVVVRSTAYSRVALGVTGAAGVFLLLWWLRDLTKRRGRGTRDAAEERAHASAGSR